MRGLTFEGDARYRKGSCFEKDTVVLISGQFERLASTGLGDPLIAHVKAASSVDFG